MTYVKFPRQPWSQRPIHYNAILATMWWLLNPERVSDYWFEVQ